MLLTKVNSYVGKWFLFTVTCVHIVVQEVCQSCDHTHTQNIARKTKRSRPTDLKELLLLAVSRMMFPGVRGCTVCISSIKRLGHVLLNFLGNNNDIAF